MTDQYAALDVEATGMMPGRGEIIEVAVVVFTASGDVERFASLVRPRGRVSLDVLSLTGLSTDELREAPTFGDVAQQMRRLLAGRPIVGHSAAMDVDMLAAGGLELSNPIFDTFQLATLLLPDLPNYSLPQVALALGVERPDRHRAEADADLTAAVFRAMLERIDSFDGPTLERLASLGHSAGWPFASLFDRAHQRRPAGPLFAVDDADARGVHELAFLTNRERPEPLRRTGSKARITDEAIAATLAPGGPLSRVLPGYEHRDAQERMASAVASALDHDGRLVVEAGTGTGKSVAYLVPAALHAVERGERVVVSTNTLALQDQLHRKDVPDLQAALVDEQDELVFRSTVLKGRANYLCLRRWFMQQRYPVLDAEDAQLRAKVTLWLSQTASGDRGELRLTPREESLFRHVSADGEACVAARCPYQQRNQCFLFRARRAAENAHVVIVNHALLLSDLAEGSRVLPDYEHLIIDEAHHLEDQATTQFGFSVSEPMIADYLDRVVRLDGPNLSGTLVMAASLLGRFARDNKEREQAAEGIERLRGVANKVSSVKVSAVDLFVRVREFVQLADSSRSRYDRSLRLTTGVRRDGAWLQMELTWEDLDRRLRDVEEDLIWYFDRVEGAEPPDRDEAMLAEQEDLVIELGATLRESIVLRSRLQEIVSTPTADAVYWLEVSQAGDRTSVHAAPLHVGQVLNEQLFEPLRTLVLTSATLSTDGSFDFLQERLGLDDADELSVPSPFDYERSTLLYIADDIPEPNAPTYQRRLEETLFELGAAMGGRMLILFTSYAALQATYRAIRGPLEDRGVIVLGQRIDGNPRQLIDRLRQVPNVVVLGTSTFWEGVDVVGPALSALVITKLPFSVPSDPVFSARSEQFEEPFLHYAVPQAVLRFKQGFGRLIRSSQDRGVCAVLDRRVISKRYGASFVESLPSCSVAVGSTYELPNAAIRWLELADELAAKA
ncbi:MAG: helicase C-terminal domain-containing protein [Thermomicrobiales bacterium]